MCFLLMTSGFVVILKELYSYIQFVSRCLTDGVRNLDLDLYLMGEGMACGGLPFSDTGFPVPSFCIYCIVWSDESLGYCFYIYPPP